MLLTPGWWFILKLIWGGLGLGAVGVILIVLGRARGGVRWYRAIQKEMAALSLEAERSGEARQKAIGLVIGTCREISDSFSPEHVIDAERLFAFIRAIAACFFPHSERPELQVSLGQLIKGLDASLSRFDQILHRPGLKQLQSLNVKTVQTLYRWSNGLVQGPWAKWYLAHQKRLRRVFWLRLVILPDPVSWVLFLSRKLVILILLKNLLLDITLYIGKLAIDTFDQPNNRPAAEDPENIEETLEALSHADPTPTRGYDPEIAAIRHHLVGLTTVMFSDPTFQRWRTAVREAAEVIARRHFPNADHPLEEAAIGPLLNRTRSLLSTLGKGDSIFFVRYLYQTRIETLLQAKEISTRVLTPKVRGILKTAVAARGWIKWPLKLYRRLKRFSLPGIAADVGWVLGKKTALMLIYGRTFDQACTEMDVVYRQSAAMDKSGSRRPADSV
ncbi:hypothetical protein JCM12296A_54240 [Desulfosarcina cetonica]|uniref:hypothetical protein n=1 Tax=Desulfosarcina cetonica TaxID=90730 RepID=UPI0006D24965|nr:hypothetical protein [Desulfosarcina cetonica]